VVKLMEYVSVISSVLAIHISCRINNRRFSILRKFEAYLRIGFSIDVVFYRSILTIQRIDIDTCTYATTKIKVSHRI